MSFEFDGLEPTGHTAQEFLKPSTRTDTLFVDKHQQQF